MAIRECHGWGFHFGKWARAGILFSALWLAGLLVPSGSMFSKPGLAMEPKSSAVHSSEFSPAGSGNPHILLAMGLKTENDTKPVEPPHAPGQVLVRFKKEVSRERIDSLLSDMHLEIKKTVGSAPTYLVKIPGTVSVKVMVERLKLLPEVAEAGANYQTFLDPRESGSGAKVRPKE